MQLFREAKRTAPSVLYVPHIQLWWDTVGSALKATFLSLLQDIPPFSPILLLATCSVPHHGLFQEVPGTAWGATHKRTPLQWAPVIGTPEWQCTRNAKKKAI